MLRYLSSDKDKVKRQVHHQDHQDGGLWVPNFEVMSKALNLAIYIFSINLLVVYRESLNLIGYITRRLSADSLQL